MVGRPEDVRRWAAGQRAAEQRILEEDEADGAPAPGVAWARAADLLQVFEELHGWPPPYDDAETTEDLIAHERWALLRSRVPRR